MRFCYFYAIYISKMSTYFFFSKQNDNVFQILAGPTFFVPYRFRDRLFRYISQNIGGCHTPPHPPPNVRPCGQDTLLPLKSKLNVSNDLPWISQSLKKLIRHRQAALARGDETLFKSLRNQVNREHKSCRGKFYSSKVEYLKTCSRAEWWKEAKKLSGISSQVRVDPISLSWADISAGVPQGTKLGPWLFIIMINDLKINDSNIWKFVDDTTLDEIVGKNEESKVQTLIDDLTRQISESQFKLNETKCKELRIGFCKPRAMFDPIIVNGEMLEVVDSAKILGLTVSNNLKWNIHIDQIISKARKRLYFLSQLKRARVGTKELVLFFTTCI